MTKKEFAARGVWAVPQVWSSWRREGGRRGQLQCGLGGGGAGARWEGGAARTLGWGARLGQAAPLPLEGHRAVPVNEGYGSHTVDPQTQTLD